MNINVAHQDMGGKPTTPFWDEETNSLQLLSIKDLQKIGLVTSSCHGKCLQIRVHKSTNPQNSRSLGHKKWESIRNRSLIK